MRFLRSIWLVLDGLVLAGAAIVVVLVGVDRPKNFWTNHHHTWLFLIALALVGVTAGLKPLVEAVKEPRGEHRRRYERKVEEILTGGFVKVVQTTGFDFTSVGMHAFLVRGIRPSLKRVGRVRLVRRAGTSGVRWTKGKGVIGTCWQKCAPVMYDIAAHREAALSMSAKAWDELPAEMRLGMTHQDYQRASTAGTIMAAPIQDDSGKFRGCVSLDAPAGSIAKLDVPEVWQILNDTAHGVWVVGRRVEDL